MGNLRSWRKYDRLKLIVAIILVVISAYLYFGNHFEVDAAAPIPTQEQTKEPEETTQTPTPTKIPTMTDRPTDTPTPTPTEPNQPPITDTPTPTPTFTPSPTATQDICSLALKSRLDVGITVTVTTNLNFRASPGLDQEIKLVSLPGDRLEIIGGPICIPHLDGAYMWWQVQRTDGNIGWSAEGSLTRIYYFLEP